MKSVLALDLGTSSLKACVYDACGEKVWGSTKTYPLFFPAEGYREQRPADWWAATCGAVSEIPEDVKHSICAIGVSGHSLGVVALDAQGRLLADCTPIWSDARACRQAAAFFRTNRYEDWYARTGCGLNPELYPAFKMRWYRENMPELYANTAVFLGTKDYLNYRLTGVTATDRSYASGSGVFLLRELQYDGELAERVGIDAGKLPPVLRSDDVIGGLTDSAASALGLRAGIPVVAGGVDNACMTLGAGCFEKNAVYASLGASAWVAASTDAPVCDSAHGVYVWVHCVEGMYVPSVGIHSSGTSRDWVQTLLFDGPDGSNADSNVYDVFDRAAEEAPVGSGGVLFVPVLAGPAPVDLALPCRPDMRGAFLGLTLSATRGKMARACLEGIAMELNLTLDVLSEHVCIPDTLHAVGGGTKSEIGCAIYADVLNRTVAVSRASRDAAALGAAALALRGSGIWKDFTKIKAYSSGCRQYAPRPENVLAYAEHKKRYKEVCQYV